MELDMVPVSEAKTRLHEIVAEVATRPVLLLRRSRPEAVVVSYERWMQLRREIEDLRDRLALHQSRATSPDMRIGEDKVLSELGLAAESSETYDA